MVPMNNFLSDVRWFTLQVGLNHIGLSSVVLLAYGLLYAMFELQQNKDMVLLTTLLINVALCDIGRITAQYLIDQCFCLYKLVPCYLFKPILSNYLKHSLCLRNVKWYKQKIYFNVFYRLG